MLGSLEDDGCRQTGLATVPEAVTKFFADATARQLSKSTISKQKNVLEKRLLSWCSKEGIRLLKQLDVDALRRFRATWPDSPITASRNLERLRNFFGFCLDAGWIPKNPAKAVRPPKTTQFEPEDFENILAGCDSYSIKGIHREGNRIRLKAMILLLRYSGLRIRDAATLERARIKNGKLFLYTQKTGTPVWLPLPPTMPQQCFSTPSWRMPANRDSGTRPENDYRDKESSRQDDQHPMDRMVKEFGLLSICRTNAPDRFCEEARR